MTDKVLCNELTKKFLKDIGGTPYSFGKAGLTHKDLRRKETLKLSEEKGVVQTVPMWYGEAQGLSAKTCALICSLSHQGDDLEVAGVVGFRSGTGEIMKGSGCIGFYFDWKNEQELLKIKLQDKWLPLDMSARLRLGLGFETMVQEGVLWNTSPSIPEPFLKNLQEMIEVDEEVDEEVEE